MNNASQYHKGNSNTQFWNEMRNYQVSLFPSNELNVVDTTAYFERQDTLYNQKIINMREERLKLESEHHNLINKFCDNALLVKEKLENLDSKFQKTSSSKIQIYNKRINWYKQETQNAKSKLELFQNDKTTDKYFDRSDVFNIQKITDVLFEVSLSKFGNSHKIQQDLSAIHKNLILLEKEVESIKKKY